jgi:hypothetical protein
MEFLDGTTLKKHIAGRPLEIESFFCLPLISPTPWTRPTPRGPSIYDFRVTGDLERVQQTCEQWVQAYPRDTIPHLLLGTVYQVTGKHEKMVQDGKITIQLDPESFAG